MKLTGDATDVIPSAQAASGAGGEWTAKLLKHLRL
jgi:hypothetical protein